MLSLWQGQGCPWTELQLEEGCPAVLADACLANATARWSPRAKSDASFLLLGMGVIRRGGAAQLGMLHLTPTARG